jgi:hypothetical protein
MTINIALLTADALIFGCDSYSSVTQKYIDPFSILWRTDASGAPVQTHDGKYTLDFGFDDLKELVVDVHSGVTKMFVLHRRPIVVAVTAGLGMLRGRTIAAIAGDFYGEIENRGYGSVRDVAEHFLDYVGAEYQQHFEGQPDWAKVDLSFLIGGYAAADRFPSLFRLHLHERRFIEAFAPGQTGVAYNGQADAVERVLGGVDVNLRFTVLKHYRALAERQHKQWTDTLARVVNEVLEKIGAPMPADVNLDVPAVDHSEPDWTTVQLAVDFAFMSKQDAIDFVSFLVNLQSGAQKFARGAATVGGRTHIGVVTKAEGYQVINPPKLVHRHTGFGDAI